MTDTIAIIRLVLTGVTIFKSGNKLFQIKNLDTNEVGGFVQMLDNIINSWIDATSFVFGDCTIENSTIKHSIVRDSSKVHDSTIRNSYIQNCCTVRDSTVSDSQLEKSTIHHSVITTTELIDTNVDCCTVEQGMFDRCKITYGSHVSTNGRDCELKRLETAKCWFENCNFTGVFGMTNNTVLVDQNIVGPFRSRSCYYVSNSFIECKFKQASLNVNGVNIVVYTTEPHKVYITMNDSKIGYSSVRTECKELFGVNWERVNTMIGTMVTIVER